MGGPAGGRWGVKSPKRKPIRGDGLAVRTYPEISVEMMRRFGIRVSPERVQQLCSSAERKIARRLREVAGA